MSFKHISQIAMPITLSAAQKQIEALTIERDALLERVKAADEMAVDLSITADNAQDAAKTDARWEGVSHILRARIAAYRATQALS